VRCLNRPYFNPIIDHRDIFNCAPTARPPFFLHPSDKNARIFLVCIPMASHELPEWEGTGPSPAPKRSIFNNPTSAPFDKAKSFFSRKRSSFQAFDKENAVDTSAPSGGLPSSRKYYGLRRRTWIIITVVVVILIALIIGLAVGLHHKSCVLNLMLGIINVNLANYLSAGLKRRIYLSPPIRQSSPAT
jgi:hypothetical protein